MTFRLQRFQHVRRHETCHNTSFLCHGANNSTKLAPAKCAGAHKAAVSQFGQVKLHLKSDPLKKVILSHSSERGRPSGQQLKEDDRGLPPSVPALSTPKVKPPPSQLSLRLTDNGLRQELMEILKLYQVSPVNAISASEELIHSDSKLVSLAHVTDFSAAGVVAISFWPPDGHIRILMTQECGRKSKWFKKLVKAKLWKKAKPFGILGGKRQKVEDSPRVTALREVTEETAGSLSDAVKYLRDFVCWHAWPLLPSVPKAASATLTAGVTLQGLLSAENLDLPHSAIFLGAPSNFCAFLHKLEGQNGLPEAFSKILADPNSDLAASCTTKALAWVPVRDLARLPRGHFFDKLLRESIIPAWLCAQQREYDQQALEAGLATVNDSDVAS